MNLHFQFLISTMVFALLVFLPLDLNTLIKSR